MSQYLAGGALQAGGVVAGRRQRPDTELQSTDHFVTASKLWAQILDQMLKRRRLIPHFISASVTAAASSVPATTLTVLRMGQRRAHL